MVTTEMTDKQLVNAAKAHLMIHATMIGLKNNPTPIEIQFGKVIPAVVAYLDLTSADLRDGKTESDIVATGRIMAREVLAD